MMERKKTLYIAGAITGVEKYWEPFEKVADHLASMGYTVLTPSTLPKGLDNAQAMRICFTMIDSADAVLFLPNWLHSNGARLEQSYCHYTGKPCCGIHDWKGVPAGVWLAWLEHDVEEVLKQ